MITLYARKHGGHTKYCRLANASPLLEEWLRKGQWLPAKASRRFAKSAFDDEFSTSYARNYFVDKK